MVDVNKLVASAREWATFSTDKRVIEKRQNILKKYGAHFAGFGKLILAGNFSEVGNQNFTSIANYANRFSNYDLSINEFLNRPTNTKDANIKAQIEAENTGYLMLLNKFNQFTETEYGEVFPEFRVNAKGSCIHLQTLSEFITDLLN